MARYWAKHFAQNEHFTAFPKALRDIAKYWRGQGKSLNSLSDILGLDAGNFWRCIQSQSIGRDSVVYPRIVKAFLNNQHVIALPDDLIGKLVESDPKRVDDRKIESIMDSLHENFFIARESGKIFLPNFKNILFQLICANGYDDLPVASEHLGIDMKALAQLLRGKPPLPSQIFTMVTRPENPLSIPMEHRETFVKASGEACAYHFQPLDRIVRQEVEKGTYIGKIMCNLRKAVIWQDPATHQWVKGMTQRQIANALWKDSTSDELANRIDQLDQYEHVFRPYCKRLGISEKLAEFYSRQKQGLSAEGAKKLLAATRYPEPVSTDLGQALKTFFNPGYGFTIGAFEEAGFKGTLQKFIAGKSSGIPSTSLRRFVRHAEKMIERCCPDESALPMETRVLIEKGERVGPREALENIIHAAGHTRAELFAGLPAIIEGIPLREKKDDIKSITPFGRLLHRMLDSEAFDHIKQSRMKVAQLASCHYPGITKSSLDFLTIGKTGVTTQKAEAIFTAVKEVAGWNEPLPGKTLKRLDKIIESSMRTMGGGASAMDKRASFVQALQKERQADAAEQKLFNLQV